MFRGYLGSAPFAVLAAIACLGPAVPIVRAQGNQNSPLIDRDFQQVAPRGFGDRNNSWAQAMIWWHNNLYVGTSRASLCGSLYGVHLEAVGIIGSTQADIFLPYPPHDPDLSCAVDPADLPLQAEIWRWSPKGSSWQRVFQSPATLPNPGIGPPSPPRTGKFLPYEIAFRGFTSYTESDGTEALYAFGINSTILWDRNQLPPPRILRTTDGSNWNPLPQTPGTFLGSLPFNPDHSSFRSPVVYNGKMFVLSGPVFGQGSLIGSANPSQGDNAWFLAGAPTPDFYELAVFNGWLYLGGFDPTNGYAIFKTRAEGPPPYALTMVVPPGAGLTVRPSKSVVSMFVRGGRLYVGTATFPEIIRINADDTWDLVMGSPRIDPMTNQWKYPISNLDAGFGHTLNDHVWYMSDAYNYLYAGTYNASTGSHLDPVFGPLLLHNMGAHLYITPDDWYYSAITTNGFSNPADPFGGKFDFGVRTMTNTPYGMFLGTANDYYGLAIFLAGKSALPSTQSPSRLDIEPTRNGSSLLSWIRQANAKSYQVWRANMLPILVRDDINFEDWNGVTGNKIPDTYVSEYQPIGMTTDVSFIDSTVLPGSRYMYYVVGLDNKGGPSIPTNLVTFPVLLPPVTFAQALDAVDTLSLRQRFISPSLGATLRQQVVTAQAYAAACQISRASNTLNPSQASGSVLDPDSADIGILLSKLIRRLQLYGQYPTQMISTEFCSGSVP